MTLFGLSRLTADTKPWFNGAPPGLGADSRAMKGGTAKLCGVTSALLLCGAAFCARAETTLTQNPNAFIPGDASGAPHKSLQLDTSGRWTLKLDMDPPVGRETGSIKDMSAGAYFHITPSMRIGGTVGLGDRQGDVQQILPQDVNSPRVHLETKFKF